MYFFNERSRPRITDNAVSARAENVALMGTFLQAKKHTQTKTISIVSSNQTCDKNVTGTKDRAAKAVKVTVTTGRRQIPGPTTASTLCRHAPQNDTQAIHAVHVKTRNECAHLARQATMPPNQDAIDVQHVGTT